MTETTQEQMPENTAEIQTQSKADQATIYELAYHIVPTLDESARAGVVESLRKAIEERGGTIMHEVYPEHFELAYTMQRHIAGSIQKFDTSHLGWINFTLAAESVPELHDLCEKNESLIRFILVKTEREFVGRDTRPMFKRESETSQTFENAKSTERPAPEVKKEEMSEEEVDKAIEELVV